MPVPKKRFGGSPKHQAAILRSMVTALVKHERIRTITQRAKELKRLADRVVSFAKRAHAADAMTDTGQEVILHNRRAAASVIFEYDVLRKLFEELGPRYAERNGGYVRVLKLAKRRKGDDADMSIIEFIDRDGELRKPRPVGQAAVAARAELAAQIAAEVAAGRGGELLQASYKLHLGGHEATLPTTAGDAPPASEPDAPPGASDGGGRPAGSSA